jgi:hypothetical protein
MGLTASMDVLENSLAFVRRGSRQLSGHSTNYAVLASIQNN